MKRPYVICHMYLSIDGKIDGKYMEQEGCDISGEYYDDIIFKMGTAMAGGRVTLQMYKAHGQNDLSKYSGNIERDDYIIKAPHYNFCFDRMGKCFYDDIKYNYGGQDMQIVEVVSSKCDSRYLEYLRDLKISYIIADSVKEALEKIYLKFKVERLVLTGGSIINGGFLSEDCIDELSLVIAPYIEGNIEFKQFVGNVSHFVNKKFKFKEARPLDDGGVHLIFKKED